MKLNLSEKISDTIRKNIDDIVGSKLIRVTKTTSHKKDKEVVEYFAEFKKEGSKKITTALITELDYLTMKDVVESREL